MIGTAIATAALAAVSLFNGVQQTNNAKRQLNAQKEMQAQQLAQAEDQAKQQEMQYNAANQQAPNVEDFDTGGSSGYSNILSGLNKGYTIQDKKLNSTDSFNNGRTGYERYNNSSNI